MDVDAELDEASVEVGALGLLWLELLWAAAPPARPRAAPATAQRREPRRAAGENAKVIQGGPFGRRPD
jgi:hypothetical protein